MFTRPLILATRRSPLALIQANNVAESIKAAGIAEEVELLEVTTTGDRQTKWSLEVEGGKGLFTKEIEEALLTDKADAAMHSAKDLPTDMPEGLTIAAYLPRDPVHDILVRRADVDSIKCIATGSPRRRSQLKKLHESCLWKEIRGNVETRLRKVASGKADATVLAAAGLQRLGIKEYAGLIFEPLGVRQVVPAVGQGAIAVQTKSCNAHKFAAANHTATARAVSIERSFLAALGGGCQSSTAAHSIGRQLLVFHEDYGFKEYEFGNGDVTDIDARIAEIITILQSESH